MDYQNYKFQRKLYESGVIRLPLIPEYILYEKRLESFKESFFGEYEKISDELAKSGFYSVFGCVIRCFYCEFDTCGRKALEGSISNIKDMHNMLSPFCGFLKFNSIKPSKTDNTSLTCKICFENEIGVVFLPCGHHMACTTCIVGINKFPICRKEIKAFVRTFNS